MAHVTAGEDATELGLTEDGRGEQAVGIPLPPDRAEDRLGEQAAGALAAGHTRQPRLVHRPGGLAGVLARERRVDREGVAGQPRGVAVGPVIIATWFGFVSAIITERDSR